MTEKARIKGRMITETFKMKCWDCYCVSRCYVGEKYCPKCGSPNVGEVDKARIGY